MVKVLSYEIRADQTARNRTCLSVRFRADIEKKDIVFVGAYEDIHEAIKGIIDFEYRRMLLSDPDQDLTLTEAVSLYEFVKKRIMDQIEIPEPGEQPGQTPS